jgi:hypothetical protein
VNAAAAAPARAPARRTVILGWFLAALVSAALFGWALSVGFSTLEPFDDYVWHNRLAERMAAEGRPLVPHPLYHVLAIALGQMFTSGGVAAGGFAVVLSAQVALAILLQRYLRGGTAPIGEVSGELLAAGLALAVLVAAPLDVFTPGPGDAYFGYFPPNALHSPTTVLARPLALGLFIAVAAVLLRPGGDVTWRRLGQLTVLTIVCALAKPHFVACLAPAIAVVWLLERPRRRATVAVLLAVALPAAALLAWQTWFTLEADGLPAASVAVRPFEFLFRHMPDRPALVAYKLGMSVLFPAAVALGGVGRAGDASLRLAWAAFGFGVLQAYLLTESGPRHDHGNFLWGGQLAAFVLFAASARSLASGAARARSRPERLRWSACALVLCLHAAVGLEHVAAFARVGSPFGPSAPSP